MTTPATSLSFPSRSSGGAHPVALVTGANHGIGAATARALAARGARVLVTGLALDEPRDPAIPDAYDETRDPQPESVAAAIRTAGGSAAAVTCDLADDDAAPTLFDAAAPAFDAPVRILVNNAAGWVGDSFTDAITSCIAGSEEGVRAFFVPESDCAYAQERATDVPWTLRASLERGGPRSGTIEALTAMERHACATRRAHASRRPRWPAGACGR